MTITLPDPLVCADSNILSALRPADLAVLAPFLSPWTAREGATIYEPGDMVDYVYFPCGPTLFSYVVVMEDGREVETVLIGREGAVGGIVSHGRLPAFARARVQFSGPAMRMPLADLEAAKLETLTLRHFFARYADCLMAQVFQSIACNAVHSVEQRAVKWILAALERTGGDELPLTHEQIAALLGVGRGYVSRTMRGLRDDGSIRTGRKGLRVIDREKLARRSCRCNAIVRRHFEEVLEGVYPSVPAVPSSIAVGTRLRPSA